MTLRTGAVIVLATALVVGWPAVSSAQTAKELYTQALTQERTVRDAGRAPTLRQIRSVVAAYERVVRRYPGSGYADNALWQAGDLSRLAWERFGNEADRRTGIRVLKLLQSDYRSSPFVSRVDEALANFDTAKSASAVRRPPVSQAVPARAERPAPAPLEDRPAATSGDTVMIRAINRSALPDGVRVSIEMDRELLFRHEQLENPRRVFFDFRGALPASALLDRTLTYPDDVVREIRFGRHPQNTTRVVMDTEGIESYSVFTLYNPYRLVVDFRRPATAAAAVKPAPPTVPTPVPTTGPVHPEPRPVSSLNRLPGSSSNIAAAPAPPPPAPVVPSRDAAPPALSAPAVPSANSNGQFSLARQLGLGVSRIVIDAGHGGHDPGAHGNGLNESELVLDVAVRLKKLLDKQAGIDVVMTRETDVYIPLEQRTAMANREGADLFLSIHANASRNQKAQGVETYFLNFASNPEAEAVAARENSASGQKMSSLPEIVRAIALNNKIDESRDFAEMIQKSMVQKLSPRNKSLRDLGVKQAPFVVLIGAGMPSVLAEISFLTNKQEGQLLKTAAYRDQIAEALFDAVTKYQKSLKAKTAIASKE
jgi:N-acetylmuramoyl-L-alanine amidase